MTAIKFDFSNIEKDMISKGVSNAGECIRDLKVIVEAIKATGLPHAMTEGADVALHHVINDTVAHLALSAEVAGLGNVLVHDPRAYGTAEFDAGWDRTRAAFSAAGDDLPVDYRNHTGGFRSAATCVLFSASVSDLQMAA